MKTFQIKKRDGSLQLFELDKVKIAIQKAFKACKYSMEDLDLTDLFCDLEESIPHLVDHDVVEIEELQDLIESILMDYEYKDVAKNYILYRYERKLERDRRYAEKLTGKKIDNQNANVDEMSFGGRVGEASRVMTQDYALEHCMSTMARDNHKNNMIYIHDLDSFATGCHNCLTIPFDHLLKNGFTTRQTDVRGANSINTAFQLLAVIFQLQSLQQFGGVSSSHLDHTMVPYVRRSFNKHYNFIRSFIPGAKKKGIKNIDEVSIDSIAYKGKFSLVDSICHKYAMKATKKELDQAVEGMYHNLNTLICRATIQ
jgi:ribonucleoside-triphosphate reductase